MVPSRTLAVDVNMFVIFAERIEGLIECQSVNFGDLGWRKVKKVGVMR